MEWRCEWCGKPHDADDPPCDNCGHGSFEEAVVRAPASETVGTTTSVWVCPECGRAHPKNNPPCSRCGHGSLTLEERSTADYDDIEAPSYRDLVTPTYAVGLVVALGLAAVFVLGVTGIVAIPGLTPPGLAVADVPGNATVAAGMELADVESAYLTAINDRRETAGNEPLPSSATLDEVAAFQNQRIVKSVLTDDDVPSSDPAVERLQNKCSRDPEWWVTVPGDLPPIDSFEDPTAVAQALADRSTFSDAQGAQNGTLQTGVDIHVAPNGTIFAVQVVC